MRTHLRFIFARFSIVLLGIVSVVGVALRGAATTPPGVLGQFPAITATSLDKRQLALPRSFAGDLNLVIVSFAREQQAQVDTWIQPAQQLESQHATLRYYELPTMSRENLLYRWWFDSALRTSTTDPTLRRRILTVYVRKAEFRQALDIPNEKHIVAILVNRSGNIFWRADGPYSEEHRLSLTKAMAANGL